LRAVKSTADRQSALHVIASCRAAHDNALDAVSKLLIDWAQSLLDGRNGRARKVSSVGRYLSALAPFPALAGHARVLTAPEARDGSVSIDLAAFEDMMIRFVKRVSQDAMAPAILARFVGYLRARDPTFDSLDLDVIDSRAASAAVRAVLIAPTEFERAIGKYSAKSAYESSAIAIASAIAFYADPRIDELAGARLTDVFDDFGMYLHIHPTVNRSTKTRRATRTLPLHILLPEIWIQRLRQHLHQARLRADGDSQALLFGLAEDMRRPFSYYAFNGVIRVLRTLTGDGEVTFHALRHSALCWILLRCLIALCAEIRHAPLLIFDDPYFSTEECQRFFATLCEEFGGTPQSALGLFPLWICRIAGHEDFKITRKSYIHILELVARAWLLSRLPPPTMAVVKRAANLPDSVFRTRMARARRKFLPSGFTGHVGFTAEALDSWFVDKLRRVHQEASPFKSDQQDISSPARKLASDAMPVSAVPTVLRLLRNERSPEEIAAAFQFSRDAVIAIAALLKLGHKGSSRRLCLQELDVREPREHKEQESFRCAADRLSARLADPDFAKELHAFACIPIIRRRWVFDTIPAAINAARLLDGACPTSHQLCFECVMQDGDSSSAAADLRERLANAKLVHSVKVRSASPQELSWNYRPSRQPGSAWILLRAGAKLDTGPSVQNFQRSNGVLVALASALWLCPVKH